MGILSIIKPHLSNKKNAVKIIYFIAAMAFAYSGVSFLVKSENFHYSRAFRLEGKSDKGKILAFVEEKNGYYLFSSELESNFNKVSQTPFALVFTMNDGYRVLSQLKNLTGRNDANGERGKFYGSI
jgi:hypothetical protein